MPAGKLFIKRPGRKWPGPEQRKTRVQKGGKIAKLSDVKDYVNKAIHANLENKDYTTEISKTMCNISNATNFQNGNMFQLTPSGATNYLYQIPLGTGQGTRVGNQITVQKAYIRFVIYPTLYNAISNPTPKPQDMTMYIFSVRRGVAGNSVSDAWNIFSTSFFANGNSYNGALGNLYDTVSIENKDVVRLLKKKTFKLSASNAQLQSGVSGALSNNDYKLNIIKRVNITKYLPKKITFNDADANSTSRQIFCVFNPVNCDGTGTASTTFVSAIFFGLDLVYEDA